MVRKARDERQARELQAEQERKAKQAQAELEKERAQRKRVQRSFAIASVCVRFAVFRIVLFHDAAADRASEFALPGRNHEDGRGDCSSGQR